MRINVHIGYGLIFTITSPTTPITNFSLMHNSLDSLETLCTYIHTYIMFVNDCLKCKQFEPVAKIMLMWSKMQLEFIMHLASPRFLLGSDVRI